MGMDTKKLIFLGDFWAEENLCANSSVCEKKTLFPSFTFDWNDIDVQRCCSGGCGWRFLNERCDSLRHAWHGAAWKTLTVRKFCGRG